MWPLASIRQIWTALQKLTVIIEMLLNYLNINILNLRGQRSSADSFPSSQGLTNIYSQTKIIQTPDIFLIFFLLVGAGHYS